ncbi:MAG TPA: RNA polymerase sigma factor [Opitutaceae bacterium]|nr:RNA polymerase sigma factor [Opitutaceae bacterium]
MELQETSRKRKPSAAKPIVPTRQTSADQEAVETILAERARFHRFLASRVGDNATAEDLLQDSLLRALEQNRKLRRGESAVPWFYRILRNAIVDHFRKKGAESRRTEKLMSDLHASGEDVAVPPASWDAAVCACFRGLLPSLKPRYAEVIRRIDLLGEKKNDVGRDLKISPPTMDVLLHRARNALRARLLVFCGACTREKCMECFCDRENI